MKTSSPLHDSQPAAGEQESQQQKLHLLLATIWERSKKTVAERVQVLRQAHAAAAKGKMDDAMRKGAIDAAHKLAGVLGTFGLPRGTDLAREAEAIFEGSDRLGAADIKRLAVLVRELDALTKTSNLPAAPANSQNG